MKQIANILPGKWQRYVRFNYSVWVHRCARAVNAEIKTLPEQPPPLPGPVYQKPVRKLSPRSARDQIPGAFKHPAFTHIALKNFPGNCGFAGVFAFRNVTFRYRGDKKNKNVREARWGRERQWIEENGEGIMANHGGTLTVREGARKKEQVTRKGKETVSFRDPVFRAKCAVGETQYAFFLRNCGAELHRFETVGVKKTKIANVRRAVSPSCRWSTFNTARNKPVPYGSTG